MKSVRHADWATGRASAGRRRSRRPAGLAGLGVRPARFLVVLALAVSVGLHWGFLQSVAWVGMVASYSRDASFTDALGKTFDGKHPCKLCTSIKKGRAEEKKQDQERGQSGSKPEPGIAWSASVFLFPPAHEIIVTPVPRLTSRPEQPPKPRPRVASASLV